MLSDSCSTNIYNILPRTSISMEHGVMWLPLVQGGKGKGKDRGKGDKDKGAVALSMFSWPFRVMVRFLNRCSFAMILHRKFSEAAESGS